MRYLHTMLRVRDLDAALDFFCNKLGLVEVSRRPDEKGRYTNVFLGAPEDKGLIGIASAAARRRSSSSPTTGTPRTTAGAPLRPPRLRGRRHLRDLRPPHEGRRHHQPPAARRRHGLRALARQSIDRALAEGRGAAAASHGSRCRIPASGSGTPAASNGRLRSSIACLDRDIRLPSWIACFRAATHVYVAAPEAARALRLAVQDAALSRRKHGFDSRRARQ